MSSMQDFEDDIYNNLVCGEGDNADHKDVEGEDDNDDGDDE